MLDGVIVCSTGVTSTLKVCADEISGQVLWPRVTWYSFALRINGCFALWDE